MSSETELAWAAGFFEGEGNVYVPPANQGPGLRVSVYQSSDDDQPPPMLLRFQAAVGGVGKVELRRGAAPLSRKPRWQWRVQRREVSLAVLALLAPYLTAPVVIVERVDA